MDSNTQQSNTTDLVLVGGGHSHLAVIKQLGMNPVAGLRVTVISKDSHTPYSGMMPGLVAGHYQHDEAHIDLRRLCQFAQVRFFQSEVTHIDLDQQQVHCQGRSPVRYDWLSINIGSQPAIDSIPGAHSCGIAVKPIDRFLSHWQQTVPQLSPASKVAIVGGGAASAEVALACQYQWQQCNGSDNSPEFTLYCGSDEILPSHNRRTRKTMTALLKQRGITLKVQHKVTGAEQSDGHYQLHFDKTESQTADEIIWAIHAGSPQWPQKTGLACDAQGFISVNSYLQSPSHPNVFAAGDIADFSQQPLAKSGVYAVRAGKHLSNNLRRSVMGQALLPYRPQRQFLSLLMTGDKQAIASRGPFSVTGKWLWRWKDKIDRAFMDQYQQLPTATAATATAHDESTMRCGGCGAKVGHQILHRVMAQLNITDSPDTPIGLNAPDDAAVMTPPANKQWLQTVDYFRAFIDDPYLLGRIATNHCLSDIYAMGATPHSALAIATIPYASETLVEDTLLQLMSGAVDSLNQQNTALIGGHSSEGAELGFGLSVNGIADPGRLLTKGNLQSGQALILTKPLGTGTLLAANMQGQAEGRWIDQAIQHMLISNQQAADIIYQHGATACTDITGFGLLGHLLEMLKPTNCGASLELHQLPVLNGAAECARNGWLSSLHPDNVKAEQWLSHAEAFKQHSHYPLLFDPQTAGGLLAAINTEQSEPCLQALQQSDCPDAAIIGYIDNSNLITLTSTTTSLGKND
ncbi:selenide, water dikinase SelD [Oceanicoccus sagamiensis]|uniref:Selenide, water dikinase SelD n=1 Tax=Oceanicoccus sagamiensis TaxID=716816 RepID=A0A1X9NGP8_9GAMM|nr:selenide, water dikinase SelD [Oceanicoccus sagamiensis]ARN76194.1 selenide, water dikinase SelD [Oceanicoccus sagamiensis]